MHTQAPSTHSLRVIEGGGQSLPNWLNLPALLIARSPQDPDIPVNFRFSKERLSALDYIERRQSVFDAWSLVHGRLPPINNLAKLEDQLAGRSLTGLRQAHACFRGMMRPVGDDNRGWDVLAYVSRPVVSVRYVPDMACAGRVEQTPDDVVFVTYVKLDRSGGACASSRTPSPSGIVTHWQFVEVGSDDGILPSATRRCIDVGCGEATAMIDDRHAQRGRGGYLPKAMYFEDADCVEYVRKDVPCVHRRIDSFLTLILDLHSRSPLGFQLKGFKNFYLTGLKKRRQDADFVHLVDVLQIALTQFGDEIFSSDDRARSYESALHIADEDQTEIHVPLALVGRI